MSLLAMRPPNDLVRPRAASTGPENGVSWRRRDGPTLASGGGEESAGASSGAALLRLLEGCFAKSRRPPIRPRRRKQTRSTNTTPSTSFQAAPRPAAACKKSRKNSQTAAPSADRTAYPLRR
jgi:hypothetical protein